MQSYPRKQNEDEGIEKRDRQIGIKETHKIKVQDMCK